MALTPWISSIPSAISLSSFTVNFSKDFSSAIALPPNKTLLVFKNLPILYSIRDFIKSN